MPANTSPIFTLTPVLAIAQVTTANSARDGTGTIVTVISGNTNGTRIHKIRMQATETTTAGMIRLFIYDGANTRLWLEEQVIAATPSATVPAWSSEILLYGEAALVIPSGYSLRASTENAEAINIIVEGGDF